MGDNFATNNLISVDCTARLLHFREFSFACAIGKNGAIEAEDKREGDGKTPLGTFGLRELFWRKDLLELSHGFAKSQEIKRDMGWCDAPNDVHYNQLVTLPFAQSHEELWRDDARYNIIIPLGYNDAPAIAGLGSAIFFHIAADDYSATEGCIAISQDHMLQILPMLSQNCNMRIY